MKVKRVSVMVEFDIYDDEVEIEDVHNLIEAAMDHAGYAIYNSDIISIAEVDVDCE